MSRCSILQTLSRQLTVALDWPEHGLRMKRYSQSKHQQIQRMSSVRQHSCETRHSFRTLAERSEAFLTKHHAFGCGIVISFRFTVTPSYIKDYCQTLELTLMTISLFSRMDHLLVVHEKQLLFSLLTFQTLLDSFASDYHWLSQQMEYILNIALTEISCALRKF